MADPLQSEIQDHALAILRIAAGKEQLLDPLRPSWKKTMRPLWNLVVMADPSSCFLATLETAWRQGNGRILTYDAFLTIPMSERLSFGQAQKRLGLSYDNAVQFGFARRPSDPSTMYGKLAYQWRYQIFS